MYEVKDKWGITILITNRLDDAFSYYSAARDLTGYAEMWYNGECIFRTK